MTLINSKLHRRQFLRTALTTAGGIAALPALRGLGPLSDERTSLRSARQGRLRSADPDRRRARWRRAHGVARGLQVPFVQRRRRHDVGRQPGAARP